MIKTEFGHAYLRGSNVVIIVDFITTTEAVKDMLIKDCYMTESQARDKILESVETALGGYESMKEKHGKCEEEVQEPGIIEKIKRKWRKRK